MDEQQLPDGAEACDRDAEPAGELASLISVKAASRLSTPRASTIQPQVLRSLKT